MQQQQEQKTQERVFDENGQTIETLTAVAPDESAVSEETEGTTEESAAAAPESAGKYRIGERYFQTQDEAITYAQSQVSALETEQQIADAYRQGMREALTQAPQTVQSVTHEARPADDLNTEELYTNPQAFLDRYANRIKTETKAELDQRDNLKTASDQIWGEFTQRHPMLADFRKEIEDFTGSQQTEVRAIIATKGRPAAYDYIATKMRSRFEAYANAVKPKRELKNGGVGASPSSKVPGVTPKAPEKKTLSFAEQIRSLKKRR